MTGTLSYKTRTFICLSYYLTKKHSNNRFPYISDEPSHDKNFDTHVDDFNLQHGKTCSQSNVGELSRIGGTGYLTDLIKLLTDEISMTTNLVTQDNVYSCDSM